MGLCSSLYDSSCDRVQQALSTEGVVMSRLILKVAYDSSNHLGIGTTFVPLVAGLKHSQTH